MTKISLPAAICGLSRPLNAMVGNWHPGVAGGAQHCEIFASGREAGGAGAALAFALDHLASGPANSPTDAGGVRAVLWVQDKAALRLGGRPYRPGLPPPLRDRLIHVAADNAQDALFALEEGMRCRDLACVIGEIAGNPRALDFTASRRLSLAAERHGVPLWLVRLDAAHDLGSARLRWDIRSTHSPPPEWNPAAPGAPSWHAELFRARAHRPGQWTLRDDGDGLRASRALYSPADAALDATTPDHGDLVRGAGDRSLAAG